MAIVGLALFAVWPLVHRGLVATLDISPWRFFGWAMYCQPKLPLGIDIYVLRGDTSVELDKASSVPPELRRQRHSYARRREIWGALLPPNELARGVLEAVADAEGVEIVVRRLVLDPSTSHIASRHHTYRYARHPTLGMTSASP